MKVLFIGGTGIISTACTKLAAQRGIEVTLLTRGRHEATVPSAVTVVNVDLQDKTAAARALAGASFDAVVDWIAFTPAHIERDLELFSRPHAAVHLHQLGQRVSETRRRTT